VAGAMPNRPRRLSNFGSQHRLNPATSEAIAFALPAIERNLPAGTMRMLGSAESLSRDGTAALVRCVILLL
jgi:hypothetical protein